MKLLEKGWIDLRARFRRLRGASRPSRLLLRLDDLDAPGPLPATDLDVDAWQTQLVDLYTWAGVLPTVLVGRVGNPLVSSLIRFCHRLEAPTTLRTAGSGLNLRAAEGLVDDGLDSLWIRMAGAASHEQLCEEPLGVTQDAVRAILRARADRKVPLKVGIEAVFRLESAREMPGIFREAKELGVDRVRVLPPWVGPSWDSRQSVMVDLLALERPPFHVTPPTVLAGLREMEDGQPGSPRHGGRCPVGGQIEVMTDRSVRSCPFHAGAVAASSSFDQLPLQLAAHHDRIRRCDRVCHHPDLMP